MLDYELLFVDGGASFYLVRGWLSVNDVLQIIRDNPEENLPILEYTPGKFMTEPGEYYYQNVYCAKLQTAWVRSENLAYEARYYDKPARGRFKATLISHRRYLLAEGLVGTPGFEIKPIVYREEVRG